MSNSETIPPISHSLPSNQMYEYIDGEKCRRLRQYGLSDKEIVEFCQLLAQNFPSESIQDKIVQFVDRLNDLVFSHKANIKIVALIRLFSIQNGCCYLNPNVLMQSESHSAHACTLARKDTKLPYTAENTVLVAMQYKTHLNADHMPWNTILTKQAPHTPIATAQVQACLQYLLQNSTRLANTSMTIDILIMMYNNQDGKCFLSGCPMTFGDTTDPTRMSIVFSTEFIGLACQVFTGRSIWTPHQFQNDHQPWLIQPHAYVLKTAEIEQIRTASIATLESNKTLVYFSGPLNCNTAQHQPVLPADFKLLLPETLFSDPKANVAEKSKKRTAEAISSTEKPSLMCPFCPKEKPFSTVSAFGKHKAKLHPESLLACPFTECRDAKENPERHAAGMSAIQIQFSKVHEMFSHYNQKHVAHVNNTIACCLCNKSYTPTNLTKHQREKHTEEEKRLFLESLYNSKHMTPYWTQPL